MKVIVTGFDGQLGHDVIKTLRNHNFSDIVGLTKDDLDITNAKKVKEILEKINPDVIIHCAAYTAVDNAEEDKDLCYDVNVNGTKYLVEEAKKHDAKFVYISTDYVFDGEKKDSYEVNDTPNPDSVYGRTKYLGELETLTHDKHFIIRISWVFGINGNNFIKTMLKLGTQKDELNVVSDQVGSPTYTADLSKLIVEMIQTDKYGIYHATNEEQCTWFEFAKEIFSVANIDIKVNPISTDEFPTIANRPKNSLLSKKSLTDNGFDLLPSWKDALKNFLKELEVL